MLIQKKTEMIDFIELVSPRLDIDRMGVSLKEWKSIEKNLTTVNVWLVLKSVSLRYAGLLLLSYQIDSS